MTGKFAYSRESLQLNLSGAEFDVILLIDAMNRLNGGKYTEITHETLSYHSGRSVSTVRRAISGLSQRGLLSLCRTYVDGKRRGNRYLAHLPKISRSGYFRVDLSELRELSGDEHIVLCFLRSSANRHGMAYSSERKIADTLGLSRNTVRRCTEQLTAKGKIAKYARYYTKYRKTQAHRSFAYHMEPQDGNAAPKASLKKSLAVFLRLPASPQAIRRDRKAAQQQALRLCNFSGVPKASPGRKIQKKPSSRASPG